MDKKKVQDFISKLQEMATQLNEPDQEAETSVEASAAVEESQNVENHAVHASVDTVSVKSHSIGNVSDYAEYITLRDSNGTLMECNELFHLTANDYVTVEIDPDLFVGKSECNLIICERVRMVVPGFKLYSLEDDAYIGDNNGVNNLYTVDLVGLYAQYGNAGFKLVAQGNQPSVFLFKVEFENTAPTSLTIDTPPTKTSYLIGESFNFSGMTGTLHYSNAATMKCSLFTCSTSLTPSTKYLTVKAAGSDATAQQPISVIGQTIGCTCAIYMRQRNSSIAAWGPWTLIPGVTNEIMVAETSTVQYRTIMSIAKSQIHFGDSSRLGLRLMLYIMSGVNVNSPTPHIRINNMRTAWNPLFSNQTVYIGDVRADDTTGYLEIAFEYDDTGLELGFNNQTPRVYYVRSSDPAVQNVTKSIPLAEGELKVDMLSGAPIYELTDIAADSTPLGMKVSHVFSANEGGMGYGDYCRLNVAEHLDIDAVECNEYVSTHMYTDGYGNRHTFTPLFYYTANGQRHYIVGEELENLLPHTINNIFSHYTYNNYIVSIMHVTVNDQIYLVSPSSKVLNNSYYKSLLESSDNEETLPVYWLLCGSMTKGFNKNGDLVLLIDEFDNYTAISYSNGQVSQIENKNGDSITFLYDNGKLRSIEDSRDRKIRYSYSNDGAVSSSGHCRMTKVEYCTVSGNAETVYKTVNIGYASTKVNGLDGYAIGSITSSDKFQSTITYDNDAFNGKVLSVINRTTTDGVPGTGTGTVLFSLEFAYDSSARKTTATNENSDQIVYLFNDEGNLTDHYIVKNGKVAEYSKYSYNAYGDSNVSIARNDILNRYAPDDFTFDSGRHEYNTLNAFNKKATSSKQNIINATLTIEAQTNYDYDDQLRCIKIEEIASHWGVRGGLNWKGKTVTEYTFNPTTRVLSKETKTCSHFVGAEEIKDKSYVTQYSYTSLANGQQRVIKTNCVGVWTYNEASGEYECDYSDKFYSQQTHDAAGRVIESRTQDGLYYDTYSYHDGTQNVQKLSHQNRSDLYYTYNQEDALTKVSGTDDGLENSAVTGYSLGEIVTLNHSGNRPIQFEYEKKRRVSKIKLNGSNYMTFSYQDKVSEGGDIVDKVAATNAKNEVMMTVADKAGTFSKIYYNSSLLLENEYDPDGNLIEAQDSLADATETYTYDRDGKVLTYSRTQDNETYGETRTYDYKRAVRTVTYSGTVNRVDDLIYSNTHDHHITKITTGVNNEFTITPEWDDCDRFCKSTVKTLDLTLTESMTYYKQGTHETTLPKTYSYSFTKGSSVSRSGYISVSYDSCENISSITYDGSTTTYTYDSLGRLEKEVNGQLGHTYTFTYDNNGNIMTKKVDNTTITYAYDGDKLTSYNGQSCVYDAIGNPTTYRGKTASWTRGRKLTAYDGNTFSYDATGRRLSKNSIKFYYDSEGTLLKQSNGLEFFYGADGLVAIKYGGLPYLCRKDMLGNILALLDSSGNIVVQYKYDAWGNHTVTDANGNAITDADHIGNLNPFRYRGYYFDSETGFYFLQSRYYDPEVGRFLNMDSIEYADPESVNGINLYAYCGNNPVMGYDPDGNNFFNILASIAIIAAVAFVAITTVGTAVGVIAAGAAIGGTVGAVTGGINGAISAAENGEDIFEGFSSGMLSGTITGSISGAVAASPLGLGGQIAVNAALNGGDYLVNAAINQEEFSALDFGISIFSGAAAGWAGGSGLMNLGKSGLTTATRTFLEKGVLKNNVLLKSLKIKELAKVGFKTFTKYLVPNLKSAAMTFLGGMTKLVE